MSPGIFISHAEGDQKLAAAVVTFLEATLDLKNREIRCTSVPGHKLAPGDKTSDNLRIDLANCSAVIGLVTVLSLQSQWVLFELGAGWGLDKLVVALLTDDVDYKHLPDPLQERRAGKVSDPSYLLDVLQRLKDGGFEMVDNQAKIGDACKSLSGLGQRHGKARSREKNKAQPDQQLPSSMSPRPIRYGLTDTDCRALLEAWFRQLPAAQKVDAHYYVDIDKEVDLPDGTAKRLITLVVNAAGYKVKIPGEQVFVAESAPDNVHLMGGVTSGIMTEKW